MSKDKKSNKFVESTSVEKSTAGGSQLFTFRLTSEGERSITVNVPQPQPPVQKKD